MVSEALVPVGQACREADRSITPALMGLALQQELGEVLLDIAVTYFRRVHVRLGCLGIVSDTQYV